MAHILAQGAMPYQALADLTAIVKEQEGFSTTLEMMSVRAYGSHTNWTCVWNLSGLL